MTNTAQEMRELLRNSVMIVKFTRVADPDDIRVMRCTLQGDLIPKEYQVTSGTPRNQKNMDESVLKVYDLDKNAWRSFRLENVIMAATTTSRV